MSVPKKASSPETPYIPRGLTTITPYFLVREVDAFIEFLKEAFDASVFHTITSEDGVIGHAEIDIGTSRIMASRAQDRPETSAFMYMYVPDVDRLFQQALAAGADLVQEPHRMYYGDYVATVRDPFGNAWSIASHVEDMTHDELNELARQMWAGRKL
jgi:uncharacterized glyoxalase superfamily protein PhnB